MPDPPRPTACPKCARPYGQRARCYTCIPGGVRPDTKPKGPKLAACPTCSTPYKNPGFRRCFVCKPIPFNLETRRAGLANARAARSEKCRAIRESAKTNPIMDAMLDAVGAKPAPEVEWDAPPPVVRPKYRPEAVAFSANSGVEAIPDSAVPILRHPPLTAELDVIPRVQALILGLPRPARLRVLDYCRALAAEVTP